MTYQDLLKVLQNLTPEQLQQTVTVEAEDTVHPEVLRIDKDGQLYFLGTVC